MRPLHCPACRSEFSLTSAQPGLQHVLCPGCREPLEVEAYPALHRAPQNRTAGEPAISGDAVCYVHVERRAERACDQCGRFMCALCDIHVGAQHLCAACFEQGHRGGGLVQVQRQRTIYPAVAVRLVACGFFLGPLAPVLCLPAIGLATWGVIKPTSITGHRYAGMAAVAILGGGLLTALWAAFWISIVPNA